MQILRYILGLFVVVLILAVVVSLLFGGSKPTKNTEKATLDTFSAAASTDATTTFTTDGSITSDETHRQIVITVSKSMSSIDIIQGYQGKVIKNESFASNEQAFKSFLSALFVAGYTTERTNAGVTDISGQCPIGQRYIYSSSGIPNVPNNLWSTSCSTKNGTFGGNTATVNQLYKLQIPNYVEFTSGVNL